MSSLTYKESIKNFLSKENQLYLMKQLYQIHIESGGHLDVAIFKEQIPDLMCNWKQLPKINQYESLVYDSTEELEHINQEFIKTYRPMYEADQERHTITPTHLLMADDYGLLDLRNEKNIQVRNSQFRYNNSIPAYRKILHGRKYDTDNEGHNGRSLEANPAKYDMTCLDL